VTEDVQELRMRYKAQEGCGQEGPGQEEEVRAIFLSLFIYKHFYRIAPYH